MLIRIVSDLHLGIGGKQDRFSLPRDNVFTVVCGDTSGDPRKAARWIDGHVSQGVFVCGNHIVYNDLGLDVPHLKRILAKGHGKDDPVTFLDVHEGVASKRVGDVVFIGDCWYTDYEYGTVWQGHGEDFVYYNMRMAKGYVNDFAWSPGLTPEMYLQWHKDAMEAFESEVSKVEAEDPTAKIVMVTHHCPHIRCQGGEHAGSHLTGSYISRDGEGFIGKHPGIKLWCCGHTHYSTDFMLGDCHVVCNQRGYANKYGPDEYFDKELVFDTDTLELKHGESYDPPA